MRLLFSSVSLLVAGSNALPALLPRAGDNTSFASPGNASYDYVIVGGGTAGLTVAARLAEDAGTTVAIIEAGDVAENVHANISKVPGYGYKVSIEGLDWGFETTAQAGAGGRQLAYNRGKALGGSSATNLLAYHRGTADSFQKWATLVGDDSWTFANFLPWYLKSVTYTAPNQDLRAANASVPALNPASQSTEGGPLHVTHSNYADPVSSFARDAWKELGVAELNDLLSGKLIGNQYSPATINPDDQTRDTSATSFLQYATTSGRGNVKVYKLSMAKRILFDGNTATGVLASGSDSEFTLSANKEVILAAGAMQSPQMLMVSGIGPAETLEKYGIEVIADRPGVGQNMQDHMFVPTLWKVDATTESQLFDAEFAAAAENAFNNDHTGILTNTGADHFGWEKLPNSSLARLDSAAREDLAKFPADWPDYEMVIGDLAYSGDANYAQGIMMLQSATSRGSISISSADAADPPVIDTQTLSTATDRAVAVEAVKRVRQFFQTESMQRVVLEEVTPGPAVQTDDEFLEFIQQAAGPGYHAACTCAMGKTSDPNAVVDTEGNVIGAKSLRVVDASVFPLLPPGHLLSTVYAVAEKLADAIKS
ncbi:alcohol oxidase [Lasiodiplodia theobromae]|nr:alcohol oxidase [Lasiodiplodia theobromae]